MNHSKPCNGRDSRGAPIYSRIRKSLMLRIPVVHPRRTPTYLIAYLLLFCHFMSAVCSLTVPERRLFYPNQHLSFLPSKISCFHGAKIIICSTQSRFPPASTATFAQKKLDSLADAKNRSTEQEHEQTSNPTSSSSNSNIWAWLLPLVLPLWLVYVSNQWSRSSLYYLVNFDQSSSNSFTAMNVDLGFGEAQYGILASLAFTSLFAIASLGAGLASDRFNRKTLTIVAVLFWSTATLGTAVADSYETVLACRILMGLACAFATPTAYTLIRDIVPSDRQATASSLYGTGVALGSALASLTLLLDNVVGWRQALNVIGATGLAAAAVSFVLLPNDETRIDAKANATAAGLNQAATADASLDSNIDRNGQDDVNPTLVASLLSDVQLSFATNRAQWIYAASFLRFSSGLCIGVWGAPYFRMVFADRISDYSVAQAAISAIGASASGILGGAIADQLSSSLRAANTQPGIEENSSLDLVGRRLWVPVVGSILAAPAWYFAVHSPDSFEISMTWLAIEYFVAECWFGPTISTLQSTVGPKIGGTAQGLFTLTGAAANLSPTLLGFLYGRAVTNAVTMSNDTVGVAAVSSTYTSDELSSLLSVAVCFGYISSAFCFAMAARASPKESGESEKEK